MWGGQNGRSQLKQEVDRSGERIAVLCTWRPCCSNYLSNGTEASQFLFQDCSLAPLPWVWIWKGFHPSSLNSTLDLKVNCILSTSALSPLTPSKLKCTIDAKEADNFWTTREESSTYRSFLKIVLISKSEQNLVHSFIAMLSLSAVVKGVKSSKTLLSLNLTNMTLEMHRCQVYEVWKHTIYIVAFLHT